MAGPDGALTFLCSGELVDDGEADIPVGCTDAGTEGLDAFTLHSMLVSHGFNQDVAYSDYRLRIHSEVNTQLDTPFPFVPTGQHAPRPEGSYASPSSPRAVHRAITALRRR